MKTKIGQIVEVRGSTAKAKLFELLPPYVVVGGVLRASPKINSYVKTYVGLDTLICRVIGEYNSDEKNSKNDYYLQLKIVGHIDSDNLVQGLRLLPVVSANIFLLEESDYDVIYKKHEESLEIGNEIFEFSQKVTLPYNSLIPSHIGIFGNTGSGKSNTLASIYNGYINKINDIESENAKILIFDLNNEYGNDSICHLKEKTLYKLQTRRESENKIPFKFSLITEDTMAMMLNASEKTQVPVLKKAMRRIKENKGDAYYTTILKSVITNNKRQIFDNISFYIDDKYIDGIKNLKYNSSSNGFYFVDDDNKRNYLKEYDKKEYDYFIESFNKIEVHLPKDTVDKFLFVLLFSIAEQVCNGTEYEYLIHLYVRADKTFEDLRKIFDFDNEADIFVGKSLCVLQLGEVNKDIRMIAPTLIANTLFNDYKEAKADEKISSVLNIVIDEAHNILYKDRETVLHNSVLECFEHIVKEGRKFGVFLTIASQRPADISDTILSQLHNYFIHKLVNPNDLYQIRKTVAFLGEEELDLLTVLSPGECVLSGTSVYMPVFIKVSLLDAKYQPNSENVILFGDDGILESKAINLSDEEESWMN